MINIENQPPVLKRAINYKDFFDKDVSQGGFNLRLREMIKELFKEMRDQVFSDTFVCNETNISSPQDIVNWAKNLPKKAKSSDTIIVQNGPFAGGWIVTAEELKNPEDMVKIPGSTGGNSSSSVMIKVGDQYISQGPGGEIDLTSYLVVTDESGDEITLEKISQSVGSIEEEISTLETTIKELDEETKKKISTIEENVVEINSINEQQQLQIQSNSELNQEQELEINANTTLNQQQQTEIEANTAKNEAQDEIFSSIFDVTFEEEQ